jgi:hypothetical protein
MAYETRINSTFAVNRNGFGFTIAGNQTLSFTGSAYQGNTQNFGTSYASINSGSCDDIRYLIINNPTTASVSIAMNSASSSFAVLQPNDFIILPPSGSIVGSGSFTNYQVKSTLPNTEVQVGVVEY